MSKYLWFSGGYCLSAPSLQKWMMASVKATKAKSENKRGLASLYYFKKLDLFFIYSVIYLFFWSEMFNLKDIISIFRLFIRFLSLHVQVRLDCVFGHFLDTENEHNVLLRCTIKWEPASSPCSWNLFLNKIGASRSGKYHTTLKLGLMLNT